MHQQQTKILMKLKSLTSSDRIMYNQYKLLCLGGDSKTTDTNSRIVLSLSCHDQLCELFWPKSQKLCTVQTQLLKKQDNNAFLQKQPPEVFYKKRCS